MADKTSLQRGIPARRLFPLGVLVVAAATFLAFGGDLHRTFTILADHRDRLHTQVAHWGFGAALLFIAGYAGLMTMLWVPAWICTIAGGFLFGLWFGVLYSLVGATLGATSVFLLARGELAGLARRAGPHVDRLEARFRVDAFNYLLVLRLVPIFPFSLANLVPALVGVPLPTFVLGTFIGIIPSTFVYANIGDVFGRVGTGPDLGGAFDLFLPILGLAVLAMVPVLYRRLDNRRGPPPA